MTKEKKIGEERIGRSGASRGTRPERSPSALNAHQQFHIVAEVTERQECGWGSSSCALVEIYRLVPFVQDLLMLRRGCPGSVEPCMDILIDQGNRTAVMPGR